jgi:hypothetical protein
MAKCSQIGMTPLSMYWEIQQRHVTEYQKPSFAALRQSFSNIEGPPDEEARNREKTWIRSTCDDSRGSYVGFSSHGMMSHCS